MTQVTTAIGKYEIESNEEEPPPEWRYDWFKGQKNKSIDVANFSIILGVACHVLYSTNGAKQWYVVLMVVAYILIISAIDYQICELHTSNANNESSFSQLFI
jgi:hypothetical protein